MNNFLSKKKSGILIASILVSGMIFMTNSQAFAHQLNTSLTFGYDNSNPTDGDSVLMTGTVTTSDTDAKSGIGNTFHSAYTVNDGTGRIQQGYLADGITPTSACNTVAIWNDVSNTVPVDGVFTYTLDTTGLGGQTLVYRAHYVTGGGAHSAATTNTACLPLEISVASLDDCEGDLEITATDTSAISADTNFGYTINVKACKDLANLKVQGGSNAWSTTDSAIVDYGSVASKTLKKNTVITWIMPTLAEDAEEELTVAMTTIKPLSCGQSVNLNGGWSVVYDVVDGATGLKSSYTDPLTFTRVCP